MADGTQNFGNTDILTADDAHQLGRDYFIGWHDFALDYMNLLKTSDDLPQVNTILAEFFKRIFARMQQLTDRMAGLQKKSTPAARKTTTDAIARVSEQLRLSLEAKNIAPFKAMENPKTLRFISDAFAAHIAQEISSVEFESYIGKKLGLKNTVAPAVAVKTTAKPADVIATVRGMDKDAAVAELKKYIQIHMRLPGILGIVSLTGMEASPEYQKEFAANQQKLAEHLYGLINANDEDNDARAARTLSGLLKQAKEASATPVAIPVIPTANIKPSAPAATPKPTDAPQAAAIQPQKMQMSGVATHTPEPTAMTASVQLTPKAEEPAIQFIDPTERVVDNIPNAVQYTIGPVVKWEPSVSKPATEMSATELEAMAVAQDAMKMQIDGVREALRANNKAVFQQRVLDVLKEAIGSESPKQKEAVLAVALLAGKSFGSVFHNMFTSDYDTIESMANSQTSVMRKVLDNPDTKARARLLNTMFNGLRKGKFER